MCYDTQSTVKKSFQVKQQNKTPTMTTATIIKSPVSSGLESDEGASPSVSDSEVSVSSGSSEPSLKIICPRLTTPRKRPLVSVSTPTRNTKKKVGGNLSKTPSISSNSSKKSPPTKRPLPLPNKMMLRSSDITNKTRNKRRRTKSERNRQAGKPDKSIEVAVGRTEDAVALDAEIDRVLEEKAVKNNLTATNVKSIIRQVITNNMVRRMIVQTVKNKSGLDGHGSSDEESFFEPTLTRAKTKELMEKQSPLWPIVATPVKVLKKPSETHMLINQDLPEDSSGDEEYVPQERELHVSEDESSSITSHASDIGSPMVATPKDEGWSYSSVDLDMRTRKHNSMFKTPPPKRKPKSLVDSGISLRTRSKLPLTDTTIETLEMQLIPPDITTDMYHWGESDNEDYLAFLKDFLLPAKVHNENNDDDEADPEYNVMEDEEDDHDREEHRMDRAVKVSKKELNELVAELFDECHLSSGDEIDDLHALQNVNTSVDTSYNQTISTYDKNTDSSFTTYDRSTFISECSFNEQHNTRAKVESKIVSSAKDVPNYIPLVSVDCTDARKEPTISSVIIPSLGKENVEAAKPKVNNDCRLSPNCNNVGYEAEVQPLFSKDSVDKLRHQLRQHVQLLAQSYVLTATRDREDFKNMAKDAKNMIMSLVRFADSNGTNSVFAVENLRYAEQICTEWPQSPNFKSPIKKKILEERFMNDEESGERNEFPHKVIKLIAENPTFMFPHLLPDTYKWDNPRSMTFSKAEDNLIVLCFEELKDRDNVPYTNKEIAAMISEVVLPGRKVDQIYGRIRNMKRTGYNKEKNNPIHEYFANHVIPQPNHVGLNDKVPIAPKDHIERCGEKWQNLINRLTYKPLSLIPKSNRRKRVFRQLFGDNNTPTIKNEKVTPATHIPIEHAPDVTPVAILNSMGNPGAYLLIPNYALNPQNFNTKAVDQQVILKDSCPTKEPKETMNEETKLSPTNSNHTESDIQALSENPICKNAIDTENNCARSRVYIRGSNALKLRRSNSDPQGYFGMLTDPEEEESEYESGNEDQVTDITEHELIELEGGVQESDTKGQGNGQGKNSKNEGSSKENKGHKAEEFQSSESSGGCGNEGSGGNGGDEDEDKDLKKYGTTSVTDDDVDDNAKKEDTDEEEPDERSFNKKRRKFDSPPSSKPENSSRTSKKLKRSPAGPSKKRPSKYNVASAEKLLEETEQDFQTQTEVEDAFTDAFLAKLQSTIEPKSPAIYNAFIQLLCDHGECPTSELQLYNKVATLLKDFPDLVKEFGSMLRENSPGVELYDFEYLQETQAQIHFMTLLTKWTADSPQLRNKVLHKIKLLREDPKMSEKDVIDMADNLFLGNSVMIKAFQDLFLDIFRPQPINSSTDFEEIDLEMEDTLDSGDDMQTEVVKMPEETAVPATSTCPCVCHSDKSNVSYASRSKHCNKCSLKFQEGKVFVHHGRVMRPVNIAMASPGSANKIVAGTACVKCVQTSPKVPVAVKESPSPPVKKVVKVPIPATSAELRLLEDGGAVVVDESPDKVGNDDGDLEEGEIVDDDDVKIKCGGPTESGPVISEASGNEGVKTIPDDKDEKPTTSTSSRQVASEASGNGNLTRLLKCKTWTIEEDGLILKTYGAERDVGLDKLETLIPHRSKEEIKSRFMELITRFQEAVRSGEIETKGKGNELRK